MCLIYDPEVHTSFADGGTPGQMNIRISGNAFGPSIPSLGLITYSWSATGFTASNGCTIGTITPNTVAGTFGSSSNFETFITLNGIKQCRGTINLAVSIGIGGATTVYSQAFPVAITVAQHYNFNYECAAPGAATTPNNVDLDLLGCAAPTSSTTLSGTVNANLSGTVNTVVSGTLGLTGTLTLNGIPDTQQEIQAIADALAAGIDVNICPEAEPCFQVLAGEIGVDVLDDTTDDGQLTTPAATVDIGNQTIIVPSEITVQNPTSDFFVPILLWAVALIVFLRFRKLLSAASASVGLIVALFGLDFPWHILAMALVGVSLWLESLGKDKIIQDWFTNRRTAWDT